MALRASTVLFSAMNWARPFCSISGWVAKTTRPLKSVTATWVSGRRSCSLLNCWRTTLLLLTARTSIMPPSTAADKVCLCSRMRFVHLS